MVNCENDTGAAVLRVRDIDEKRNIKSKSLNELAFVMLYNLIANSGNAAEGASACTLFFEWRRLFPDAL